MDDFHNDPRQEVLFCIQQFKAIAEPSAAYIAVEAGDADFTEIDEIGRAHV